MTRPIDRVWGGFLVCALLVGAGSVLVAAAQSVPAPAVSPATVIHACVAKEAGFTRIVAGRNDCILQFENYVSWYQEGIAGPAGTAGQVGPSGPQGLTGPNGAAGPTGPQGATGPNGPAGPAGPPAASGTPQQFIGHFSQSGVGPDMPTDIVLYYQPIAGTGGFSTYNSAVYYPTALNTYQQIAKACTATNFKFSGTTYLDLVVSPTPDPAPTNVVPICVAASYPFCAGPTSVLIPAGSYVNFRTSLDFGNQPGTADIYTSFTCQ